MPVTTNDIRVTIKASGRAFMYVGIFSFLINMLMLTIPIYMLQIFDRVLASQSYDTLLYLTIIAIFALLVMALLDIARSRILIRVSRWLDHKLSPLALSRSADNLLAGYTYGAQSLRDITNVRQVLSSASVSYLFDSPWVPIYVVVVFMLHPLLGVLALAGAILLFVFALLNEVLSRKPLAKANKEHMDNQYYIDHALENSESIQAMGMLPNIVRRWFKSNDQVLALQTIASHRAGFILSLSKFVRMSLQLAILGAGAYLVIKGILTPGAMIAASIITARALAPVEQSIGAWRQSVGAYQSYKRLKQFILSPKLRQSSIELPKAKGHVQFDNVAYVPPGGSKPILKGISFTAQPSEIVAIIGPSGVGKSTLARLMLGVWQATIGHVRLDGANVFDWERTDFGQQVGYVPQKVQLFIGNIKENIARMGPGEDDKIIAAAKLAGAHDLILHLPKGYDSPAGGYSLSGGQAQRIALARAFYGDPCVMVLDEPEANLDKEGENSLLAALQGARDRGVTIILISQRPNIVEIADKVLLLKQGTVQAFGPTREVLSMLRQQSVPSQSASPSSGGS